MRRPAALLSLLLLLAAACSTGEPPQATPSAAPQAPTAVPVPTLPSPPVSLPPNPETTPHASPARVTAAPTAVPVVKRYDGPLPDVGPLVGTPLLYRVPTREPVVFVTVDDGWTRDPGFVRMVRAAHVPLSLFLIGTAVSEDPAYWRRLTALGATVEDHTMTHLRLTTLSRSGQQSQVCRAAAREEELLGRRPTLLRPPYGAVDASTGPAAAACGMTAVLLWDVSVTNGRVHYAETGHLRPGDVILIHFTPAIRADFAAALEAVRAAGMRVGSLPAVLRPAVPAPSASS